MKPRHTAEQSTVKVNKAEDLTNAAAAAVESTSSTAAAPAAPARRGFGGLAPKSEG